MAILAVDPVGLAHDKFRVDIQALRGLAILLVLFHHANLGLLRAGYLGVDIFFVISGYLMTGIIKKGIERGNFTFSGFYFRRAKRLLPAAYCTFFVCALISGVFLTSTELHDFTKQLIGAVTFTGNIVLWLQTGYFEGEARFKPLLHVWSLAIEEQYYLLLPASLVLVPRRFWTAFTSSAFIVSLVLCLAFAASKPSAVFYLLPTRGWELALGSLGVLACEGRRIGEWLSVLFWPALATLALVPFFPVGGPHPGADALLVCVATLVVILRRHPGFPRSFSAVGVAAVGDFSYSLYLVHWPIFAFATNAFVSEVPYRVRVCLVFVAIGLGYLQYRMVELPFWKREISGKRKFVLAMVISSLLLIGTGLAANKIFSASTDYELARSINPGFDGVCEIEGVFSPKRECRNADKPRMLVWGDSFAMHLVPGLAATTPGGLAQATKSACAPLAGLASFGEDGYQRPWARSCINFSESVLQYIADTPYIDVVVLASPFGRFVDRGSMDSQARYIRLEDGRESEGIPNNDVAVQAMARTVLRLRAMGKRVIVVAPPPNSDFNIGLCLERKATGKLILGGNSTCQIPLPDYLQQRASVRAFLARLPAEAEVDVVSFDKTLCGPRFCMTEIDGTFLYRDWGHLTRAGSVIVAKRMDLGRILSSQAK